MPTEAIKTGWLKDKQGNKFAPKTLLSQVQTNDGTLLEDKLQTELDAIQDRVIEDDWQLIQGISLKEPRYEL